MKLHISHFTCYEYDREVQLNPHLLYLRPRENPLLAVSGFAFRLSPDARIFWMRDDFDNLPASVQFSQKTMALEIRSECSVETADVQPFDFLVRDYAVSFPFKYEPLHQFNLSLYLKPPDVGIQAGLKSWLASRFANRPADTVGWLQALNQTISKSLVYGRRDEPGIQAVEQTIALGSGTCRDYAALMVACSRTLGLAARFVSGYVFDASRNGSSPGDMHAWVEVFLPGAGWRGLDPTYGIFCDNAYVPVAHAVVAESVNPIQGSYFSAPPANARLSSDVRVVRTG